MLHKRFSMNKLGRDFVVGDLHGCFGQLLDELSKIEFNDRADRMFSVGDLIDRGKENIQCAELLHAPWFFSVKGNHEDMFVAAMNSNAGTHDMMMYFQNGGNWVYDELDNAINAPADKAQWIAEFVRLFSQLPLSITVPTSNGLVGICHAQPPEDWEQVQFETEAKLLWARQVVQMTAPIFRVDNVWKTYHGHTPLDEKKVVGNAHFIDTGAVFDGGKLTVERIH